MKIARLLLLLLLCVCLGAVGCQQADDAAVASSKYEPADDPPDESPTTTPDAGAEPEGSEPQVPPAPANTGDAGPDSFDPPVVADNGEPPSAPADDGGIAPEQPSESDQQGGDAKQPADAGEDRKDEPKDDGDTKNADDGNDDEEKKPEARSPYPRRIKMIDLPKNAEWINTRPLKMEDLKGKYVVFDFWTYCCINCIHVLPELKKLEKKHPNDLVVIGVHSAKFETEKERDNIAEAVLRYEIEHPVLVDSEHAFWNAVGVSSWPTILVIDPEGYVVFGKPGEIKYEELERVIQFGIDYYRDNNLLDETPIRFDLLAYQQKETPLKFPGKVLADEAGGRLFVTDSNHNRIVISDLNGKVQQIIGSGAIGRDDGDYATATFDHPQGLALYGDTLYVSDTENHLIRKVDLKSKTVSTIAGVGEQARNPWPGLENLALGQVPERFVGKPKETALNSPWALWVHEDKLYIAMAGPHQIWMMPLDESEIGPFAGNGREDIVDGAHLPAQPYGVDSKDGKKVSSFAQPSGLTSDGEWLFVADSEGSSIRAVPFDTKKEVRTVLGTDALPAGRLFEFGDVDGPRDKAKLQHCLGVVYRDGKIYAADTYNNKIKIVDAKTGAAKTIAGDGKPGASDDPPRFDEPAGIALAKGVLYVADTNNHLIRTMDIASGKVGTLKFKGLKPPAKSGPSKPDLTRGASVHPEAVVVAAKDGKVQIRIKMQLPFGWKINDLAPTRAWLEAADDGPFDNDALGYLDIKKGSDSTFTFTVPVKGEGKGKLTVYLPYFYCQEDGTGLCKAGEVVWRVPVTVSKRASTETIPLFIQVR